MNAESYEIMSGPNRDLLFDACKYLFSKNAEVKITFDVAAGYTMPKSSPGCAYIPMPITDIRIIGIKHEDNSGESFMLYGDCKADLGRRALYKTYHFEAWYDTKNRKGVITFN